MMFLVNGVIQLGVDDAFGNQHTLEELTQGDVIGQYSTLFQEAIMFNVKAKTTIRVLTLTREFFEKCSNEKDEDNYIPGLEETIKHAQFYINCRNNGCVPICDYKVMQKIKSFEEDHFFKHAHKSPLETAQDKIMRVAKRLKILTLPSKAE